MYQGANSKIQKIYNDPELQTEIRKSGLAVGKVEQTSRSSAVGIDKQTGALKIFINPNDGGKPRRHSLADMVRFNAQSSQAQVMTQSSAQGAGLPPSSYLSVLSNNVDLHRIVRQRVAEGYLRDAAGKQYYIFGGAGAEATNFGKSKITLVGPGGLQKYTFATPEAAFQAGKSQDPRHWAGLANCEDGDAAKRYVKRYNLNANLQGWHGSGGAAVKHMQTVVSARAAQDTNFRQLLLHLASHHIEPVEIAMDGVPGKHNHQDNKWAAQVTMSNGNLIVGSGDNNYLGRIMEQEGKKLLSLQKQGLSFARPGVPFQSGKPTPSSYVTRSSSKRAPGVMGAQHQDSREGRLRAFNPKNGKDVWLPRNFRGVCVDPRSFGGRAGVKFLPRKGQAAITIQGADGTSLVYFRPTHGMIRLGDQIVCRDARMFASGRLVSPQRVPTRLSKQAFRPPLKLQLSQNRNDVLSRGETINAVYLGMRRSADGTGLLHVMKDVQGGRITLSARQMRSIVGQHRFQRENKYTLACGRNGRVRVNCNGKDITADRFPSSAPNIVQRAAKAETNQFRR